MDHKQLRWLYLFILSLVWGSSFILVKKALVGFTPLQVGALRILITAVFLLIIGFKSLKNINRRHWKYLTLNSLLGTFFPVFLFSYALDHIDSSIGSILNSLTPLNTLIFGALIFGFGFRKRQAIGVFIGLLGTLLLILKGVEVNPDQNYWYAVLILIASIGYALNVNILKKYLYDLNVLSLTVASFIVLIIPAFIVLWFTDFFTTFEATEANTSSLFYLVILSIFGTALAKIMFNRLVQISSPIFSSSVTYLIPVVAVTWGVLDGEKITILQFVSSFIILLGVYLVNRSK